MGKKEERLIKDMVRSQKQMIKSELRSKNSAMFSEARKPEDVKVYLDNQPNLSTDPKSLASLKVNGVPVLKAVSTASTPIKNLTIVDLKLNVMGVFEDDVYASFPSIIKNIRRGNTVLRLDQEGADQKYSLGRKGLEKFFDMRYEYISKEQRYSDKCLDSELHHMEKNYILAGPLREILAGHEIEVLKTLKANGENVQVSWNETAEAWVICSKNVALVARERAHIDTHQGSRFQFACEMAHVWFDKLEAMQKQGVKIEDLIADLNGNTLIGEYVGSQEHQHLVKYSRVTIIFYAVVKNDSSQDCWPCDDAWKLFDKYSLDKVAIHTLGRFNSYDKMCDGLCQVFKDVAKSEIAEEEEGNVLYFVKRSSNASEPSKVVSLCKLKTLEYRLFRKMREKLRNYHAREKDRQNDQEQRSVVQKFIREAKELSDEHELPRSLDYYVELFKTAFFFIKSDFHRNKHLLDTEYVTFSEQLLAYFTKVHADKTFAQNSNFFFSPVLDQQDDIKYGSGVIGQVDLTQNPEKLSKNPSKQLSSKYDDLEETKDAPQLKTVQPQMESKSSSTFDSSAEMKKPTVIVVIPFALPGSGKSFCFNSIQKAIDGREGWSWDSVSSDGIRGELIKKIMAQENVDHDTAFQKTMKSGPQAYGRELTRICKEVSKKLLLGKPSDEPRFHVIFLDKNHPVNGIGRAVSDVERSLSDAGGDIIIKKVYMVPQLDQQHQFQSFPFSINMLTQVYSWGQSRKDHETLDNSNPCKMVEIQHMFLQMSSHVYFNEAFLRKNALDGFLRIPMSVESFEVPEDLKEAFEKSLEGFRGVGKTDEKGTREFLDVLGKHEKLLQQYVSVDDIVSTTFKQITDIKIRHCQEATGSSQQMQMSSSSSTGKPQTQSVRTVTQVNKEQPDKPKAFGKLPTFLGIDIQGDEQYEHKLGLVFQRTFTQAGEPKKLIDDFKSMVRNSSALDSWKFPNSHHLTTLFIGGNKQKVKSTSYDAFKEGASCGIEIRAVVYVPGKLVAGIAFPQTEVENEFPHVTLMVSQGWAPVLSNAVIKATCAEGKPFENAYDAAKEGLKPAKGAGIHTIHDVPIEKKGKNEVVFVLLREPIIFNGRMKAYF